MATLEERIRELEARRAKGETVPQLDALYEKQDALTRKGYESVVNPKPEPKPVAKRVGGIARTKRYADGGVTQQPTYPFGTNVQPVSTGGTDSGQSGVNQTFNMSPSAQAGQPEQQVFKKGGKVSSASRRADGCAIRGKTRA